MEEEKMILEHEPIPKYRKIFHILFPLGLLYLAYILLTTIGKTGGGH
ncbi:MAG: hypothetical protein GXO65_00655 [Euryarchaeota archaeon]|nr:hypothetical protein [Euryarchaeota archaeon]